MQVVCGAWNFAVGDLVPLAPVGAVLPGDFAIARRKMKGVTSNGMLCSGRELELSDDHDGILVLSRDPPDPGERFVEALGIEPDVVYDIAVEANRPDAWCMAGVARDLAARLRLPFALPDPPEPPPRQATVPAEPVGLGRGGGRRPVPPVHRPGPHRGRGRRPRRPGWPAGSPWPGCGPSTTSSTPRTT